MICGAFLLTPAKANGAPRARFRDAESKQPTMAPWLTRRQARQWVLQKHSEKPRRGIFLAAGTSYLAHRHTNGGYGNPIRLALVLRQARSRRSIFSLKKCNRVPR